LGLSRIDKPTSAIAEDPTDPVERGRRGLVRSLPFYSAWIWRVERFGFIVYPVFVRTSVLRVAGRPLT
jgi:hypothetical protein